MTDAAGASATPPPRPPGHAPRRPLGLLLGFAAFFLAAWVARHTAGFLRREPGVPSDVLTRPWVGESIGQSGVILETPWHLQGQPVPLPRELAGKIQQWTWIGHEADGLSVMAARVVYAAAEHPSLEGAADGMVKKIESTPGSRVVSPRRSETTLLGEPAIEVELRIERERGEPLVMRGIVVLRGSELIQLLSISRADQPRAAQAWVRMRDSVRSR